MHGSHHGAAGARERAEGVDDGECREGVKAGGGFVSEQYGGVGEELDSEGEAAFLTATDTFYSLDGGLAPVRSGRWARRTSPPTT